MRASLGPCAAAGIIITTLAALPGTAPAGDAARVDFRRQKTRVVVTVGGEPIATYSYYDNEIHRPYFAHLRGPHGIQLSRNFPPIEGEDPTDHPLYHPGLWMAFGDISGSDYWRNKAHVVHDRFLQQPSAGSGEGGFAVRNRYMAQDDPSRVVCREDCVFRFAVRPAGYLITWDSTFQSDHAFAFGDQEEMGLGIRVASPIRVEAEGTIIDAQGRSNEAEVWGNAAAWCDYRGPMAGYLAGMTIMAHPSNFRPSWYHSRDYGFLAANPFGRHAFGKGPPSSVVVEPGDSLRLRYGVLLHVGPAGTPPDLHAAYDDYVRSSDE